MPFIETKTTKTISAAQEASMRKKLGEAISLIRGKSEEWLMLNFCDCARMAFRGKTGDMALVSVELLGAAKPEEYDKLTAKICEIVSEELDVPKDKIYVKYTELSTWGYNGVNF